MTDAPVEEAPPVRRPYVAGSQSLMDRRPRRRDDVEADLPTSAEDPACSVMLHPDEGRYLELTASEGALWKQLDGKRTVRELIVEGLKGHPPMEPEKIGQALLRFVREGLLQGNWGPPVTSRPALLMGRIEAQAEPETAFRVFVLFFLVFLPLVGLPFLVRTVWDQGLHLMPPGSAVWGLLLATLVAMSWRQLLLGSAVLLSGRDVPGWGARLVGGVPALFFDTSSLLLAPRVTRLRVALAGLYSSLALAGIAALAGQMRPVPLPEHLLAQTIAVSLLMLFANLSPVTDSDGRQVLELTLGVRHLRDRAFAFLSRKFLSKLAVEGFAASDRPLLTWGAAFVAWAVAAVGVGVHFYLDLFANLPADALTGGPLSTRLATAMVLAAILAWIFYSLGLLVWVPVQWFLRPLGRRALATLITPLATFLAVGLIILCQEPSTARLVAGVTGFIAMFPLLRARKTFAGSPMQQVVFALGLYGGIRALAWTLGALHVEGTVLYWLPVEWLGAAMRFSPLLLLIAACYLGREARLTPRTGLEHGLVRGLGLALLIVTGYGVYRRPDFFGVMDAFDLLGCVGVAIAALPAILGHAQAPFRQFWRPLGLTFLALAASGAFAFTFEAGPWPANEAIRWELGAWPLAIAAAVTSRVWLDRRWKRPPGFPRPANAATGERSMLVLASQVLASSMFGLFEMGLGPRKAASLVRKINRELETAFRGQVMFVDRELDIVGWEEQKIDWLVGVLGRVLATVESALLEMSGRRFADWVRSTALDDLYWFEQELLRHHLPASFPIGSGETAAADRVEEIAKVPFFALLEADEFDFLVRVLRLERYQAGQRIVAQGEPAERFYVVSRGELTVFHEDAAGHEEPLGHLVEGDCFGEAAFVRDGTRAASVVACDDVELYTLERRDLESLMGTDNRIAGALEMLVRYGGFLRTLPVLSVLPSSELSKLAACLTLEDQPANKTLLRPGETIPGLYLVQDGRIVSYTLGRKGARDQVRTLTTGQALGESALLAPQKSTVTLIAELRSRVLTLSREDFTRVLDGYLGSFSSLEDLATPRAELQ